jgi:hypothetical protein
MNNDTINCPLERDVVRAAATDAWPEALRMHVLSCQECEAAAAVAPWMSSFAENDYRDHPLPDPAVLWLKAHLLQSTAAVERAARPIAALQIAAYLIIAAGWAALMTVKWHSIQSWLHGFTPTGMVARAAGATASATISGSVITTLVILSSMTLMLALHTILAEE